jgi:hypothetical protein
MEDNMVIQLLSAAVLMGISITLFSIVGIMKKERREASARNQAAIAR